MKKLQTKTIGMIGISVILSVVTILAIYGFGWTLSAEQNLLLGLAGLPAHQKWQVQGNVILSGQPLENPIVLDFSGEIQAVPASGIMDSRWKLSGETFGDVNLLNLAREKNTWMAELPTFAPNEVWQIKGEQSGISEDTIRKWIRDLQFEKAGYRSLERELGGNISCLYLKSDGTLLPAKLIDWLEKISDVDLSPQRKEELQTMIRNNLAVTADAYITPDQKVMEVGISVSVKGNLSIEIILTARPEQGQEPDLEHYRTKEMREVSPEMLEELLSAVEALRRAETE